MAKKNKTTPLNTFYVVNESKECGASKLVIAFARRIGMDIMISPKPAEWRECVLALACRYLLYPECVSFVSTNADWSYCGKVYTNLEGVLTDLLLHEEVIQSELAAKHLFDRNAVMLDLESSDSIGGVDHERIGLIMNKEGCPCGIEVLPTDFGGPLSKDLACKMSAKVENLVNKRELLSLKLVSKNITPIGLVVTTIFQHIAQTDSKAQHPSTGAYRQFPQAAAFFRNLACRTGIEKTFSKSKLLIGLLSYHLQWQMNENLQVYLRNNESHCNRHWTLSGILERLKAVKSQKMDLGEGHMIALTSDLDAEQTEIITAFGFTEEQLFPSTL